VFAERGEKEMLKQRLAELERKAKKAWDLQAETKRKQKLIEGKTKEVQFLKDEIEQLKPKAQDRDHAMNKNKELVTKQF